STFWTVARATTSAVCTMSVSSACLAMIVFLLVLVLLVVEGVENGLLPGDFVGLGGGLSTSACPLGAGACAYLRRHGCVLRYGVGRAPVGVGSRGSAGGQHRRSVAPRSSGDRSQLPRRLPVCSRNPFGMRCSSCHVRPPMGIGHNAGIPDTVIPSPARCTRQPTPTARPTHGCISDSAASGSLLVARGSAAAAA